MPIFNEVESLPTLVDKIVTSLKDVPIDYEIVLVDDGSQDGTTELLSQIAQTQPNLKAVILRRNYGQTPAMAAGFNYASGDIIITMDGDLQNDPADIPRVFEELQKGYDVVSGWRKNRKDDKLTRLLPSKIANWVIGKVTGVKLH
ncbi:MAG: glycosyltransferase family 2 protein, partial [Geitlerinemataceae cyanobacterium]